MNYLLVGVGGFVGANARYIVGLWLATALGAAFPYGTMAVNLTGSFVAGVLLGVGDTRGLADESRLLLVTGFLGGYTTFSAFTVETMRLAEQSGIAAGINVLASVGVGLVAAVAGLYVGRGL
ncbi:MAG TPA: fluoride efflux transporter CrcB [Candidatus Eisenbacteria bacterium]|nr:fluoride efflux transporter CrcB [Candidatus Eisenbacteria bacterium]